MVPLPRSASEGGSKSMILGTGSDLCNIERIRASLDRFGARFENRAFT